MIGTEQIYTEVLHHSTVHCYNLISLQGCVPQLVSYFYHIYKVTGNSVIIEAIPIGILATVSVFIWFIRADLWAEVELKPTN